MTTPTNFHEGFLAFFKGIWSVSKFIYNSELGVILGFVIAFGIVFTIIGNIHYWLDKK